MASRVLCRTVRSGVVHRLISGSSRQQPAGCGFQCLRDSARSSLSKCSSYPTMDQALRHPAFFGAISQRIGFSSSASPEHTGKEANQTGHQDDAPENTSEANTTPEQSHEIDLSSKSKDLNSKSDKKKKSAQRTEFSDSDAESNLSFDDLVKLVAEKEELLKLKQKEIEQMQDKVLRSYAEMENVVGRTKREAENSKKFAIQSFAKSLLDVADNLGRCSAAGKDSFSKIDASKDSIGAVPIVKTLLDGVEMTEKQLAEVFKKFGVEKFNPLNEQFDPHQHLAVFQMPDPSKPPGTIAAVLKSGYMLHDRVLRPAEVGVTEGSSDDTDQKSSQ